jgi:NitT/TauT family transport system permease protein
MVPKAGIAGSALRRFPNRFRPTGARARSADLGLVRDRSLEPMGPLAVNLLRLLFAASMLLSWEFANKISWLRGRSVVFDPFFVSSPSRILHELVDITTGREGLLVWSYLLDTIVSTGLGVLIGGVVGAVAGLALSNNATAERVFRPFIVLVQATPRVALIPIFVIVVGPTRTTSVFYAISVVFFIVFHNAYTGGTSVPKEILQNARLLGASAAEARWRVRLQYVLVWTFASIPNAITFGLIAVVTAEILTGQVGMGRLLFNAITATNATLTWAVIVILCMVGVVTVKAAEGMERRVLHWWEGGVR